MLQTNVRHIFIGTAKMAAQAKSREKKLGRMVSSGLTQAVTEDRNLAFRFPTCDLLAPPIIMVQQISFRYAPGEVCRLFLPNRKQV